MASVQQPFAVSAPGKVIVFGEHAVVHGRPAIAAALSLRSYLLVSPNASAQKTVTLDFPDINLHQIWDVDSLPWTLFAAKKLSPTDRVTSLDEGLVASIQPLLDRVSPDAPVQERTVHKHACMSFLYILLCLESPQIVPRTYTMRSTIPIASGLGSSASVSVCIGAALLIQTGRIPLDWQASKNSNEILEMINNWAFVGELCIHGTPSGIDNTVATRGKAVWYKRNAPPQAPSVTLLHDFPTLPLLLVNTKQPRSTAVEVAKVGKLKETLPSVTECILDAIGKITDSVQETIAHGDFVAKHKESIYKLGQLVRLNHGLLATFGVSHPKLERVRDIVDSADVGWTKLTGGGGGGCAFSLLNPDASSGSLKAAEEAIDREGFVRYETLLSAPGVGVLDFEKLPKNVAARDVQTFRSAADSPAVEALMGLSAPETSRQWQFFE